MSKFSRRQCRPLQFLFNQSSSLHLLTGKWHQLTKHLYHINPASHGCHSSIPFSKSWAPLVDVSSEDFHQGVHIATSPPPASTPLEGILSPGCFLDSLSYEEEVTLGSYRFHFIWKLVSILGLDLTVCSPFDRLARMMDFYIIRWSTLYRFPNIQYANLCFIHFKYYLYLNGYQ